MKLFLSHSNRDAVWVHTVSTQLEKLGVSVYLAEFDLQPGQPLDEKIQRAIELCDAMVVLLTENAAVSPIVREEIGYAIAAGKLVVPLVDPDVARNPGLMGMLNGHEYIIFNKETPEEGLLKLAQWAQEQVHREQQAILQQQLQRAQAYAWSWRALTDRLVVWTPLGYWLTITRPGLDVFRQADHVPLERSQV